MYTLVYCVCCTCISSVFHMALQGAVWVMEFSICGRLLATAGQDSVVVSDWSFGQLCVVRVLFVGLQRVWVLRTAYIFFHELQSQYQRLGKNGSLSFSPSLPPSSPPFSLSLPSSLPLPKGLIWLEYPFIFSLSGVHSSVDSLSEKASMASNSSKSSEVRELQYCAL